MNIAWLLGVGTLLIGAHACALDTTQQEITVDDVLKTFEKSY